MILQTALLRVRLYKLVLYKLEQLTPGVPCSWQHCRRYGLLYRCLQVSPALHLLLLFL